MTRMGIPQDLWVPDNQEFLSDNINHIIPDEYLCVFNSSHSPGNGESCANSFTISPAHLAPDPALGIAPQPAKHSSTCPGYSGSMSAPFYQPSHTTDSSYEGSQVSSGVLSRSTCLTPPSCGCPEEMSEHQYQHQPLNTDNDQLANTPDVHPTQSSLPAYEYDSSASHFGMNAINTLEGFNGRNMVFTRNDAYLVDSNYGMSALEQYTYQNPTLDNDVNYQSQDPKTPYIFGPLYSKESKSFNWNQFPEPRQPSGNVPVPVQGADNLFDDALDYPASQLFTESQLAAQQHSSYGTSELAGRVDQWILFERSRRSSPSVRSTGVEIGKEDWRTDISCSPRNMVGRDGPEDCSWIAKRDFHIIGAGSWAELDPEICAWGT